MLRLGEVVIITSNHDHSRDHRVLCDIDNYKEKFDADLLRVNEFNLFILRTLWNLDVCSLLLPHLKDLISSKYER